ncbi:MAG: diguanylate cyclase [Deltaproteobacteria bacterium]|nr:diguanylate cyclase [Deltaproteobacteria bacterium]
MLNGGQRNKKRYSVIECNRLVDGVDGLFQDMPVGALIFSLIRADDFKLEYANHEATVLLGTEHESCQGLRLGDLFFGGQERRLTRNLLKVVKTGNRFESDELFYRNDSIDRYTYRLIAYPLSDKHLVVTLQDITKQKRLEEELRESKARLRALTETAFEGMVVHVDGTIIYANPAFGAMFGYKDSQLVGLRLVDLVAPESREPLVNAISNKSEYSFKTSGKKRSGALFPIEIAGKYCMVEGQVARIAVIRTVPERELVKSLEAEIRELSQLSNTDGLTGLVNHRHFQDCLAREVERSRRTGLPLSLIMIDIDRFKDLNDRYGHQTGDAVLMRLAKILCEGRRINDIVARYGGEEFAILLADTPPAAAAKVAERLRARVASETIACREHRFSNEVTLSFGVASCPLDASEPYDLVYAADSALYEAKRLGRNRVELASSSVNSKSELLLLADPLAVPIRQ